MSLENMEAVRVKNEPAWESEGSDYVSEAAARAQPEWKIEHEIKLEGDAESSAGACGVSSAAASAGLYKDHHVKDELVLGPEVLQPPDVVYAMQASLSHADKDFHKLMTPGRTCSVRLQRMLVDLPHQTCRIGSQTYKFQLYMQSHQAERKNKTDFTQKKTTGQASRDLRKRSKTKKEQLNVGHAAAETSQLQCHLRKLTGKKTYKCAYCIYVAAKKSHLTFHLRTHTGEKPYKCDHCSYAAARKHSLAYHIKTHTREKPYKCDHCSYAAAHKNVLENHNIRKHTDPGDKPYKCDLCSYATGYKGNLKVHERRHIGEKCYECSHCSYTCLSNSALLQHEVLHTDRNHTSLLKNHTEEKPYKCERCSYATAYKNYLNVHYILHMGAEAYNTHSSDNQSNGSREVLRYGCDICFRDFDQLQSLQHHLVLEHAAPRPSSTDSCHSTWPGPLTYWLVPHSDHTYARQKPYPTMTPLEDLKRWRWLKSMKLEINGANYARNFIIPQSGRM